MDRAAVEKVLCDVGVYLSLAGLIWACLRMIAEEHRRTGWALLACIWLLAACGGSGGGGDPCELGWAEIGSELRYSADLEHVHHCRWAEYTLRVRETQSMAFVCAVAVETEEDDLRCFAIAEIDSPYGLMSFGFHAWEEWVVGLPAGDYPLRVWICDPGGVDQRNISLRIERY